MREKGVLMRGRLRRRSSEEPLLITCRPGLGLLSARLALAAPMKRVTRAVQPKENWKSTFSRKSTQSAAKPRS